MNPVNKILYGDSLFGVKEDNKKGICSNCGKDKILKNNLCNQCRYDKSLKSLSE